MFVVSFRFLDSPLDKFAIFTPKMLSKKEFDKICNPFTDKVAYPYENSPEIEEFNKGMKKCGVGNIYSKLTGKTPEQHELYRTITYLEK